MMGADPSDEYVSEKEIERSFHSLGYARLGPLISPEYAYELVSFIEQRYHQVRHVSTDADVLRSDVSLMRIFEADRRFRNIMELKRVIGIVERILGMDCHVVAQNALRTPTGKGVVNWHIDDVLFFPFLAEMPEGLRQSITLPCYSLNIMIALSDITEESNGPTQIIAGSHRIGQEPEYAPVLPQGTIPTSLLATAGEGYIVNSQTWHRGSQNISSRTRYLLTTTFGRRFISQRFYPFLNYKMPREVLDGATPRLLRLLGRHEKGPYG